MSIVEGLSVQGIRSFGPEHREVISFNTPLTLIVGYNGSGKTTLIECLKYATTGYLPPNSKGGAFVYDPQLANEKEVPASIVLKFKSTNGAKYVVNRHLKITANKNRSRKFQTIETSIKELLPNGERNTLSAKVGHVDELVPTFLGVSPAILDDVIFCHQDESLWPMSEPSALKKKFDQIFESLKYAKALDMLKLVRKRKGEELRILQVQHKQNENNKDRGQKNQTLCEKLTAQIDEYREEVDSIDKEMHQLRRKEREAREGANKFLGIMNDLKYNMDQYEFRHNAVVELRESIEMMTEDDRELQKALDQYENRLERLRDEIEQYASNYRSLQNEVKDAEDQLNLKLGEKGKLQSDKDKYERQLQTRIDMIQDAANRHEIRGFDGELTDDQIRTFNSKIQSILSNKKKEYEQLQNRMARDVDAANTDISRLENEKNSKASERVFAKQKKAENDRKVKRLQTEIDSVECDEVRINRLENESVSLKERYQRARDAYTNDHWDESIRQTTQELRAHEQEAELLGSELVNCTRLAADLAELNLRKTEARDREASLKNLTVQWNKLLVEQVRPDWTTKTLEKDFHAKMDEMAGPVNMVKEACDQLEQKLKQVDFKLSETNKQYQKLAKIKTDDEKAVIEILCEVAEDPATATIDTYDEELQSLEDTKVQVEKDLNLFDKMKSYWTDAETCLDTKNKCYMCDRVFDEDRFRSKLVQKIAKHLKIEAKVELKEELREVDKNLERLRAVRPKHDSFLRLQKELPALEKEIENAKAERDRVLQRLEEADDRRKEAAEQLEALQSMSRVVSEMSQLSRGITEANEQIERLEKSQQRSTGSVRTPDEVNEARSVNAEAARRIKQRLENLSLDRQRSRDMISNLELENSKLDGKITEAKQLMNKKQALSHEIKALKEENQAQDEIVLRIDAQLSELQPRIDAKRAQRDNTLTIDRKKAENAAEERDNISRTLTQLKITEVDIQDYVDRGGVYDLASVERSIHNLQQSLHRLKDEMEDLTNCINTQKEGLAQADRNKKNIRDNLKFRENCAVLEEIGKKIEELKTTDADKDYDRLMAEAGQCERKLNILAANKSEIVGQSKATDNNLKQQIEIYEQEYQDAEGRFRESAIQMATTKGAIADLATLSNSLDKAIIQFHWIKMEEVNRIAGELWRATYQGTDVDTIAIRSENDLNGGASQRRNYNYRVTMVKQDTEMDMRGRCSAGQKVLASIIIRLALAESFGVNCGLVALDEPTTNLDSDNIRSLAVSLHRIIKARQAQANFQLIVITHDEEFLRHMRSSDFCDSFFRIKRDENQCSTITKENITRITE